MLNQNLRPSWECWVKWAIVKEVEWDEEKSERKNPQIVSLDYQFIFPRKSFKVERSSRGESRWLDDIIAGEKLMSYLIKGYTWRILRLNLTMSMDKIVEKSSFLTSILYYILFWCSPNLNNKNNNSNQDTSLPLESKIMDPWEKIIRPISSINIGQYDRFIQN